MKKTHLFGVSVTTIVTTVICIGAVCGIPAYIFGSMKFHPVYRMGLELAKNDPAVIEFLGSPVKGGFLVIGTEKKFRYGGGTANWESSVSGSRKHGRIFIFGTENEDGTWRVDDMDIRVDGKIVFIYRGSEPDKGFQPHP